MFGKQGPAAARLLVSAAAGLLATVATFLAHGAEYAPAAGWFVAAAVFGIWTFFVVHDMDGDETQRHATQEDPTLRMTHGVLVVASVASVGGVGYLLIASSDQGSADPIAAGVGIAAVAASWSLVHTLYTLRYARLYCGASPPGGVDFNQDEPPTYADFAYLAFTLGMTYQVSDTDLKTRSIRSTALHQALLSYLLGAVVLAVVINLVASLAGGGGGS